MEKYQEETQSGTKWREGAFLAKLAWQDFAELAEEEGSEGSPRKQVEVSKT